MRGAIFAALGTFLAAIGLAGGLAMANTPEVLLPPVEITEARQIPSL